tara:strand:- start:640 stop:2244 length:1605 start_codon:yes stop_codon:yes gene_type:complete
MFKILNKLRLTLFFKSNFYNFIVNNKIDEKIQHNPESLWTGNKLNGLKIIDGFLNYQKETVFIDENVWKRNHGSQLWNNYLNSFMWVPDVRAVGTNQARIFLRKKILDWIEDIDYSDKLIWKEDVLAKRIFYLLTNLSFFFETANEGFQKKFAKNINKQCLLLLKISNNKERNIFSIKSLILSSLCFENLKSNYSIIIDQLNVLIKKNVLEDGVHYLRSPSEQFFFLCSLLDIRNFLGNFHKEIPFEINRKISEMSTILKLFRIADGHLAIFNKYDFIIVAKINNVLKKANNNARLPKVSKFSDFYRIANNKIIFIMDCGTPTSEKTHAGSLSFELSYLTEKIVVNCGSPFVNNKDWDDAMRSTAAHSTLNINEINSSDIFFNKDTTSRIANVGSEIFEEKDNVWINSYHTGYKKIFGLIHKRSVHLDLNNHIIRGEDSFKSSNKFIENKNHVVFLRFHIHPSIELNVTTSRKKVVLKLKNNMGWEFICSEARIKVEDGIYLGENKIVQPNQHILIRDDIIKEKKIRWLFRLIK